jgi:cold shock CspA family protein
MGEIMADVRTTNRAVAWCLGAVALLAAAAGAWSMRAPADIRICEETVRTVLKSPSSYRRGDYIVALPNSDGTHDVFIHMEATNGYGALTAGLMSCEISTGPNGRGTPKVVAANYNGRAFSDVDLIIAAPRAARAARWSW